jgi:hypothetical protein
MTTLEFTVKVTLGVYRAEILNNSRFCAVQNCGALPQAAFDLMHKNHHNGGISGNFLVFHHGMKDYEIVNGIDNVHKLIDRFALAD